MHALAVVAGAGLVLTVLWDTLETIVLPRTVNRRVRLTRLYYQGMRAALAGLLRAVSDPKRREGILSIYGPLSLPLLFALWAFLLIIGFGLVHWGLGLSVSGAAGRGELGDYLYYSGVTFLTLGYGDLAPQTGPGRAAAVVEAGVGFGFLAVVISYLPVLYQSFSRREVTMTLLDARAGSPPTAPELLRRHAEAGQMAALADLLLDMERWASELLESYLSYPILAFYRSQHTDESWLTALTAVLDSCALVRVGFRDEAEWSRPLAWQARLTFAMARHVIIDLALILGVEPAPAPTDRLTPEDWARVCATLERAGIPLCDDEDARAELAALRRQYEPYVAALGDYLYLAPPPWTPAEDRADNWQTGAGDEQPHF